MALLEDLRLVKRQILLRIDINIGSKQVIYMLKHRNLHYGPIHHACNSMLRRVGHPAMVHCFREQNNVSESLVKE